MENAVGAAVAGRSLVCAKVGMSVTPTDHGGRSIGTHAGMVWLIGDDPGAWGSQNEQDSRYLGAFAEVPILEPSSPQEGYRMMGYAFELSERYRLPLMLR
jgi:indolepyruvate ferredoxin oxidoreductase alpha subunit